MKLIEVPSHFVSELWPLARKLVADACTHSGGRYSVEDVLTALLDGTMQIWIMMEDEKVYGVALAEIIAFPRLKECRILCATGEEVEKWAHFIENAEMWARRRGCTKMMLITRPGWKKLMAPFDYKMNHIQLEKDLGYVH